MREKKVKDIVLPYQEGVAISPSVSMLDKMVHAIEVMLNNNLRSIAVIHNDRPIGMVRLADALHALGLQMSAGKNGPRTDNSEDKP